MIDDASFLFVLMDFDLSKYAHLAGLFRVSAIAPIHHCASKESLEWIDVVRKEILVADLYSQVITYNRKRL